MKMRRYSFLLAAITAVLSVVVLAGTELSLPEGMEPVLIGQASPALGGIKELCVLIVPPDSEPNKDGLVWEELQAMVESKLADAGVKYIKPRSLPTPELRVCIDMLKLDDSERCVFRVQTSLARTVTLLSQRNLHLLVDVWETKSVMELISAENVPDRITDVVLEQVESFILAYLAANPTDKQPSDANEITVVPKERVEAVAEPAAAEYKYVASKKSKVFHKADCSSAKRIAPKNLIGYNSREEAVNDGKRPCKICKP